MKDQCHTETDSVKYMSPYIIVINFKMFYDKKWCRPGVFVTLWALALVSKAMMKLPDINSLAFPNHKQFVAGQIHTRPDIWRRIKTEELAEQRKVIRWVEDEVDNNFIVHFKGRFRGEKYDCDFPPSRQLNNANKFKFLFFKISSQVLYRSG